MPIITTPTAISDVLIIEPRVFSDDRGWFYESFNQKDFSDAIGYQVSFVQDNHSCSLRGSIRGLHYQMTQTQAKLVRVCRGAVYDVAVDLRESSPTFGQWVGVELSAENKKQLWIPKGFAHGFMTLSDTAEFLYKTTDFWHAESEKCIIWDDSTLNIKWPYTGLNPILNTKDLKSLAWHDAPKFN